MASKVQLVSSSLDVLRTGLGGPVEMHKTRIAVVDDNADNRLIIRTILEDLYEIDEFSNGVEAIENFKKDRPAVVIMDISLPEMDGIEILRHIRADSQLRDLPIIALTAHAMVGDREKYLAAGFNEYLAKPILDMNLLFKTIRNFLPQAA
jgi:CheY-like chemotaxis protein